MDTQRLRREHGALLRFASQLTGLAATLKTRADAVECRAVMDGINTQMVSHLTVEDDDVYPALMASPDPSLQSLAREAFAEMGVIHGGWTAYRDLWTVDRIVQDKSAFSTATAALMKALSLRIAMENEILYPALERATETK
jgi:hemerythrin-like domain-containing protein